MKLVDISTKEAVKMVANCRSDRLPIVLEVLEQAGFSFSADSLEVALKSSKVSDRKGRPWGNRTAYLKDMRRDLSKDHWLDTDNEASLALRKAFEDGLRLSKIAEYAGVSRKQPYVYMYGKVEPNKALSEKLIAAIEIVRKEIL